MTTPGMTSEGLPRATVTRRFLSAGPAATLLLAESLGRQLAPLGRAGLVVALEGDLGAGKTVFVRGLARGLGLSAEVSVPSPTFTIAQRFPLPGDLNLEHLDAYRLSGVEELEAAGIEDLGGSGRVTCVEWAAKVASALPAARLEVRLMPPAPDVGCASGSTSNGAAERRELTLEAFGLRPGAALATWRAPQPDLAS